MPRGTGRGSDLVLPGQRAVCIGEPLQTEELGSVVTETSGPWGFCIALRYTGGMKDLAEAGAAPAS